MNKQLLIDCIPFEISPSLINEIKTNNNSLISIKGVLQRANAVNQNGRVYPKKVLEKEVERYINESVKHRSSVGELDHPSCLCSETSEILTSAGWKLLKDVSSGEDVFTLNTSNNEIQLNKVNATINEKYKGKAYKFSGRGIDVTVTPTHRFPVCDRYGKMSFVTAVELFNMQQNVTVAHLTIPKTGNWISSDDTNKKVFKGLDESEFSIRYPKAKKALYKNDLIIPMDLWTKILGIYLAEGHTNNTRRSGNTEKKFRSSVFISQKKISVRDDIRSLLNDLPEEIKWSEYKKSFCISDPRIERELSLLGSCYDKYLPSEYKNLGVKYLENIIEYFIKGDGRDITSKEGYSNRKSMFSTSRRLIEDLHEILFKCGTYGKMEVILPQKDRMIEGRVIKQENIRPLYEINLRISKNIHVDFRFLKIEEVDYSGNVYCVSVDNETFFCRDNKKAFWSGNSSVIEYKNVSHVITEIHWEGDNVVGTVEVLTTPAGNILRELIKNNIKIGISSRALGSVTESRDGNKLVGDDLALVCWDVVSTPSTQGAWMSPINLNEGISHGTTTPSNNNYNKINSLVKDLIMEIGSK